MSSIPAGATSNKQQVTAVTECQSRRSSGTVGPSGWHTAGKTRAERSPPDEHHLRRCREKHAHRERRASARVVGGWGTSPGSSVGPLPLRDDTHLILCVCACVPPCPTAPDTHIQRRGVCTVEGVGRTLGDSGTNPTQLNEDSIP